MHFGTARDLGEGGSDTLAEDLKKEKKNGGAKKSSYDREKSHRRGLKSGQKRGRGRQMTKKGRLGKKGKMGGEGNELKGGHGGPGILEKKKEYKFGETTQDRELGLGETQRTKNAP